MSSNNKLVQTIIDAATLTGLAASIGWAAKKVVKDPSSNVIIERCLCFECREL